jgi:hypothetical protein
MDRYHECREGQPNIEGRCDVRDSADKVPEKPDGSSLEPTGASGLPGASLTGRPLRRIIHHGPHEVTLAIGSCLR